MYWPGVCHILEIDVTFFLVPLIALDSVAVKVDDSGGGHILEPVPLYPN